MMTLRFRYVKPCEQSILLYY